MDIVIFMLQDSAKDLEQLAMHNFCPRCFWIKSKVKVPYQTHFPGVFSFIYEESPQTLLA